MFSWRNSETPSFPENSGVSKVCGHGTRWICLVFFSTCCAANFPSIVLYTQVYGSVLIPWLVFIVLFCPRHCPTGQLTMHSLFYICLPNPPHTRPLFTHWSGGVARHEGRCLGLTEIFLSPDKFNDFVSRISPLKKKNYQYWEKTNYKISLLMTDCTFLHNKQTLLISLDLCTLNTSFIQYCTLF